MAVWDMPVFHFFQKKPVLEMPVFSKNQKNARFENARFIQKIKKNARFDIARIPGLILPVIEESVSQNDEVRDVQCLLTRPQ